MAFSPHSVSQNIGMGLKHASWLAWQEFVSVPGFGVQLGTAEWLESRPPFYKLFDAGSFQPPMRHALPLQQSHYACR